MTNDEYLKTQQALLHASKEMLLLDLDEFLERIEEADTLGPILDPTLFVRGGELLKRIKGLAEIAGQFATAGREYRCALRTMSSAMGKINVR